MFALGRRDALFREKLIDAGTLVTLSRCDHRAIATYVKAHRGVVAVRPLPPPPVTPGCGHVTRSAKYSDYGAALESVGAMSITALYRYLSEVGVDAAGAVKEASIFSHAWERGPLLYNTNEVERGAENEPRPPPRPERFELDFDARPKDFLTENVDGPNGWPQ